MTANEPFAGSAPQSRAFACPVMPRPWGEMTSGIAGLFAGPYDAGRMRYALRRCPSCARYGIFQTRTLPVVRAVIPPARAVEPSTRPASASAARASLRMEDLECQRSLPSGQVDRFGRAIESCERPPCEANRREPLAAGQPEVE